MGRRWNNWNASRLIFKLMNNLIGRRIPLESTGQSVTQGTVCWN